MHRRRQSTRPAHILHNSLHNIIGRGLRSLRGFRSDRIKSAGPRESVEFAELRIARSNRHKKIRVGTYVRNDAQHKCIIREMIMRLFMHTHLYLYIFIYAL